MTERISIFNYEAFYLDYLEGNLSVEDTALLFAFLEQNPELKLDEELQIDSLEAKESILEESMKNNLKEAGDEEKITVENASHFFVLFMEGQMTSPKEKELFAFLDANPKLKADFDLFQACVLESSEIIFDDKESLKRKDRVLWPYWSGAAAAACAAIVYLLIQFGGPGVINEQEEIPTADRTPEENNNSKDEQKNIEGEPIIHYVNHENNSDDSSPKKAPLPQQGPEKPLVAQSDVPILQRRSIGPIQGTSASLAPISMHILENESKSQNPNDMARLDYAGMVAPIEPITRRINDRFNTDIDFRTAKATDKERRGFYLKIGKFEVMHKGKRKRKR